MAHAPAEPATASDGSGAFPPGHTSFRRQRASRACETCHARKVRCDAASLGIPCTNCVAFSIECRVSTPKRKKGSAKARDSASDGEDAGDSVSSRSPAPPRPPTAAAPGSSPTGSTGALAASATARLPAAPLTPLAAANTPRMRLPQGVSSENGLPPTSLTQAQAAKHADKHGAMAQMMKPKFARAPIREAGRVAYLGESSNLALLVHDRHGSDVVHYPLPDTSNGGSNRNRLSALDSLELDILHQRGAFLLPPRNLCDDLVDSYFRWLAPVVPIINRSRFMRQYRDEKDPPSLLLLQAVLLAGSRVCTNPQIMDANGSTTPAAMTFYKRAKALYDANYEDDRVTIVQALVLMGWYWEGPEDVTKNVFYWTRVAIVVAQGTGMHRSVEGSQLSRADKRLWKRIWWTLYTRDRSVAVALGRPVQINVDDADVEMITEDDFVEDDADEAAEYPPDHTHVQFFLQYVRLCEIMGLVLAQQYPVASKVGRQKAINLAHSDMALADWLQNCPPEVKWEKSRHHFWSALLHSNYYTTLCLLHRAHMPSAAMHTPSGADDAAYPSRTIAFQAAGMITSIVEALSARDELRYTPAFIVYSLFSALIMHVYQMRSTNPTVVQATQDRIQVCMDALKEVSKVWLVAKMVHTLFVSILGNKSLEERLQKAAGNRHKKPRLDRHHHAVPAGVDSPPKTKFQDMSLAYSVRPPAPAVSFERSRPQTPASLSAARENAHGVGSPLAASAALPSGQSAPGHTMSPTIRHNNDAFMGGTSSRANTHPTTPFNASYSLPATPPDLYLVTRNSPTISQSLWENFQPDQLFPESSNTLFNGGLYGAGAVPNNNQDGAAIAAGAAGAPTSLDPSFPMPSLQTPGIDAAHLAAHPGLASATQRASVSGGEANIPANAAALGMAPQAGPPSSSALTAADAAWAAASLSPGDDAWSNSSRGGPAVPTTLNVEDWYQFFGVNGGDVQMSQEMAI